MIKLGPPREGVIRPYHRSHRAAACYLPLRLPNTSPGIYKNGPRAVERAQGGHGYRSVVHYRPSSVQENPNRRSATSGFLHHPLGRIRYRPWEESRRILQTRCVREAASYLFGG